MINRYFVVGCGSVGPNTNFDNSILKPIKEKRYKDLIWGLNEKTLKDKKVNEFNSSDDNIWVILFPNAPMNYAYAIGLLKKKNCIRKRELGPLVALDKTNEEVGWNKSTNYGYSDFTYLLNFEKLYLLKEESFESYKIKGQSRFFEVKKGIKNEGLLDLVEKELPFIKRYVKPIEF